VADKFRLNPYEICGTVDACATATMFETKRTKYNTSSHSLLRPVGKAMTDWTFIKDSSIARSK